MRQNLKYLMRYWSLSADRPNGKTIGAELAGIKVDEQGFIPVDKQQRTNVPIFLPLVISSVIPCLAHKAVHEGKVAAEVIAGHKAAFDALTIPSVAYTDPEVAWMGLTENQAKQQGIEYEKGAFPWAASGRSLSMGRKEGLTKILSDKETGRILGAGMVGTNAGELIAEAVLALEMGADVEDIGLNNPSTSNFIRNFGFCGGNDYRHNYRSLYKKIIRYKSQLKLQGEHLTSILHTALLTFHFFFKNSDDKKDSYFHCISYWLLLISASGAVSTTRCIYNLD